MTRIILTFIASAMLWVNIGNAQDTPVVEESEAFLKAVSAFENKEFQIAVELFTVLGEQGEPTSQHNLSILYFKGLGSPANYKRALYWAWRASLGGSEPALALVDEVRGIVTEDLVGIVSEEIVTELTAKAMAGDKNASERLGKTYYNLFVEPDLKMAYIWFLISQAFGNDKVSEFISEIEDQIEIKDRIAYQEEATEIFTEMPK
jgi:TPR repeat protein|tara:strand:- start:106 stop:720 length:615 start_codon:yes stop_codon:yes gene_type:complete